MEAIWKMPTAPDPLPTHPRQPKCLVPNQAPSAMQSTTCVLLRLQWEKLHKKTDVAVLTVAVFLVVS